MALTDLSLLLMLLLVHFVSDFSLQPSSWIEDRYKKHFRSKFLYLHAGIHGLLSLAILSLFIGTSSTGLYFAAIISGSHWLIDLAKSFTAPAKIRWFIIDQLLHVFVVIGVWVVISNQIGFLQQTGSLLISPKILLTLTAYFLVVGPFGILIGMICQKWAKELTSNESLKNAGKRIGQLERFLILTFILIGQFAAIGFLLAAKSVLRYGDANEPDHRKVNEYVLVGTMTSFSITIAFGLIIKILLDKL